MMDNSIDTTSDFIYMIYVLGAILLVIMLLNILIAVISDTFDQVYTERHMSNIKAMADSLLDISPFFTFSRSDVGKYHMYTYLDHSVNTTETEIISARWVGKIKETSNKTILRVKELLLNER